jgi:hypothetical protein
MCIASEIIQIAALRKCRTKLAASVYTCMQYSACKQTRLEASVLNQQDRTAAYRGIRLYNIEDYNDFKLSRCNMLLVDLD